MCELVMQIENLYVLLNNILFVTQVYGRKAMHYKQSSCSQSVELKTSGSGTITLNVLGQMAYIKGSVPLTSKVNTDHFECVVHIIAIMLLSTKLGLLTFKLI